jgi:hypothetical protein
MKKLNVLLSSFLIAGCTIGNGHICGPQTPTAYCNKDAYDKLMHPKPYGAHWIKEGMTRESRAADWLQCGGEERLSDGYERQSGITTKEYFEGLELHRKQIRGCMGGKGYFWIEQCDARCL